jgi:hypothetical protein
MKTLNHSLVSLIIILLASCTKDGYQAIEEIQTKEYYSSDIIPDSLQTLYGSWTLFASSGGFTGGGNGKEFDYLVFKRNGIFGVVKDGTLIAYGKITLTQKTHTTEINFIPTKSSDIDLCADPVKNIYLISNDTLNLNGPCCDRYNLHLKRKK